MLSKMLKDIKTMSSDKLEALERNISKSAPLMDKQTLRKLNDAISHRYSELSSTFDFAVENGELKDTEL